MKITFIKPNLGRKGQQDYIDEGRMEPLQFGVLAGMTPQDIEVVLYDDRMESIPYDEPTDLVAINAQTFSAKRAYEISAAYRKRGVKVIIGGMHASLLPEEVAAHADAVYVGDAEFLWHEVLQDCREGKLKSLYHAPSGIPQPGIRPRRDIFKGKGYLPITLMQFGRGCPYICEYCAISVYFDRKHYYRRIDEVLEEIASQDRRNIFFVDDNLVANFAAAKIFFRELRQMNVCWVSQGSIDMTRDLELMNLMAQSGCLGHVIGFESLNPENLRSMRKTPNLKDGYARYEPQLNILRDFGLQTWAAFTLGHDHDTPDSIKETLDFAIQNRFIFAAFNVLAPYPRTPLYQRLEAEGRLLFDGKWWLHPDYRFNHAAFVPARMTPDELTFHSFEARKTFNSLPSLLYRAFDFKTNMRSWLRLAVYLLYTPLFRKETFKKQGLTLGQQEMTI
jgi:radical SAM superfamily enzyme YgiQ (UPF0313 family)